MIQLTRPSAATVVVTSVVAGLAFAACVSAPGRPAAAGRGPVSVRGAESSVELPLDGHRFASRLNRYRISVPSDWTAAPATRQWGHDRSPRSTGVGDVFRSPDGLTVTVASQPIPAGTTQSAWTDRVLAGLGASGEPPCPLQRQDWRPVVVDGHHGGLVGGDFGCQLTAVVVVVARRGYVVEARPDPDRYTDAIFPQRLLERLLAGVRLPSDTSG